MMRYQTLTDIACGFVFTLMISSVLQVHCQQTSTVLEILENKTIIIDCGLHEQSKIVLTSTIRCNRAIKDFDDRYTKTVSDEFATLEVRARRNMNGSDCRCTSRNVTNGSTYTITTTFTLSVLYPSEVREFEIQFRERYYSVAEGSEVKFSCKTRGNPVPSDLQLFRILEDGQPPQVLHEVKDVAFYTYSMEGKCNESAQYGCKTENYLNTQPWTEYARFRVACAPIYCTPTESAPKFAVTLNRTAEIRLCVFTFPEPTTFRLSKGIDDDAVPLPEERYNIVFNSTNENRARGELIVTIKNISQSDLGNYTLFSGHRGGLILTGGRLNAQSSNLYFELRLSDDDSDSSSTIVGAVVGGIVAVAVLVVGVIVVLEVFKPGGIRCRRRPVYDKPDPRTMNEEHEYRVINNDPLYSSVDDQPPSSPLRRPSVGRVSTESGYIEIIDDVEQPPVDDGYIQPVDKEPYYIPERTAD